MMLGERDLRWVIVSLAAVGFAVTWQSCRAAPAHNDPQPAIETTIGDLRAHPEQFAGKMVKLAGQLDECMGWECSLCPEAMTMKNRDAQQCVELGFRPMIAETGFGSKEQEQVFRFSSVVLTATFDPTCWEGGRCTDRQVALENAQIVSVGSRRASRIGLWLGDTSPLTEMTGPVPEEMKAAAAAAGLPHDALKVFQTPGKSNWWLICRTDLDGQPGSWPGSVEGALYAKSTRDFYSCHAVRKVGDRMVVQAAG